MTTNLNLVSASAGRRLGAKLIDGVPPVLIYVIALGIGLAVAGDSGSGNPVGALLALLLGCLAILAYAIWLWIWEARTGKTPGNLLLGLRTTGEDGFAPGMGAVFLRGLIVGVSGIVPIVGPVVVLISNLWDPNGQRQGWHDKVARTFVVDVRAGRDPLTTGGLYGPQSFAGEGNAADAGASGGGAPYGGAPVGSVPVGSVPVGSVPYGSVPYGSVPAGSTTAAAEPAGSEPSAAGTGLITGIPGAGQESVPVPAAETVHPDEDLEMTRVARRQPAAAGIQLMFDDGAIVRVAGEALIGRNPAPLPGEGVAQLIDYADLGRSVSKTHLHIRLDGTSLWVTDRNSTNGSAVATSEGQRQALNPSQPVLVPAGSTVYFGDRHFVVGSA
jgi:uncharacterized RDD family membrane protein YckC